MVDLTRGRVLRCLSSVLLGCGALALAPAVAHGGLATSAAPTFPVKVTVGDTGVPASITMENRNTAPQTADTNIICNNGDPEPPCDTPELGIMLTPSCKQLSGGECKLPGADPGVVSLSATGTGALGTSCASVVFDIALYDLVLGSWRFTPRPAGAHVTLPGFGSLCTIDFTFDVLKMPVDQDAATPGVQTAQHTGNTQVASFGVAALSNNADGTANGTTFLRAQPSIATTASASVAVGAGSLTDTAVVSGRVNPQPGATIVWRLYGPNDATCSGAPIFTSTAPYPVAGGTVTSGAFTPSQAGTYRWRATYSGDANNEPAAGACNAANESVIVTTPPPPPPPPPTPQTPPPPPQPTEASSTPVRQSAARVLGLRKTANRATVRAGGLIAYTIRVTNATSVAVRRVRVCDRLPSGVIYVSSTPRATRSGGRYCWTIATLPGRSSRRFSLTTRTLRGISGIRTNVATLSASGVVRSVTATARVRVLPIAARAGGVTG